MKSFFQKKYANYFLKPFLKQYLKKSRIYRYNRLALEIYPSVFHPKYFFSTSVLAEFLNTMDLPGKTFCEVGAGSGLISFLAHQKGAEVVCFDLNIAAVEGMRANLRSNFKDPGEFKIYLSDLFDAVPPQKFDMVFINPPYFFKKVSDTGSMAWNCGENGEYFNKLFRQLYAYTANNSKIFMILADNCDIVRISTLASGHKIRMNRVFEKKVKWEKNYIFKLELSENFD